MKPLRAAATIGLGLTECAAIIAAGCALLVTAALCDAEPEIDVAADDEPVGDPDAWCAGCRVHRVRQDTYSGVPSYVPLCPVCSDRRPA